MNIWGSFLLALGFSADAFAKKCREFRPDVIHFHNTFPLVSPLCLKAAKWFAPVVMTLHNYRTVCVVGIPMRDDRVCTLCLDKRSVRDAVKHRCYRRSLVATIPLALNIWVCRKRWSKWVDRFIVLSEFQKRRMVECGWKEDKLVVKGNFTVVDNAPVVPAKNRKDEIVYVGRISCEKGVFMLLEAWKKVLGDNRNDD
jgi:glycosyltransferase involved in cell wall biosynthesis